MSIPSVWPCLVYRDSRAAIKFLTTAFGLTERAVYADGDGVVQHAELTWGNGGVMLGRGQGDGSQGRTSVHLVVDDPDGLYATATAAGATIVSPPEDTDYGSRMFVAEDTEGNIWSFGTWYER